MVILFYLICSSVTQAAKFDIHTCVFVSSLLLPMTCMCIWISYVIEGIFFQCVRACQTYYKMFWITSVFIYEKGINNFLVKVFALAYFVDNQPLSLYILILVFHPFVTLNYLQGCRRVWKRWGLLSFPSVSMSFENWLLLLLFLCLYYRRTQLGSRTWSWHKWVWPKQSQ